MRQATENNWNLFDKLNKKGKTALLLENHLRIIIVCCEEPSPADIIAFDVISVTSTRVL